MAITIPEQHRESLSRLVSLPESVVDQIATALHDAKPAISPAALSREIARSVSLPIGELTSLVAVLLSLTITRMSRGAKVAEIAHDVAQAAVAEGLGEVKLGTADSNTLEAKLLKLLSAGASLDVTGRAADVYFAHDTLFKSARVLSDIRPIFGTGDLTAPAAGMVVHNLQLTVAKDREFRSEFFALNVHDLRELRRVVERALEKDRILREVIQAANMTYVEDVANPHQK